MYWITKDGSKLLIKNMEDSHIKNCITMLERSISEYYHLYPEDQEIFSNRIRYDGLDGKLKELERELKKRG